MTDREALYRAILADPDDDTLRLIYADALEEEGDGEEAAFIRAQVELASLPAYDPRWVLARRHERETAVDPQWVPELPRLAEGLNWAREPFRRGLPASIQAPDTTPFVAHADDLFERFPIESLELTVAQLSGTREFASSPWVSRLVRLSISQGLSGPAATLLLGSQHYKRLRELHIGAGLATAATAAAVARSAVFKQLTTLGSRDDRGGAGALVNELIRLAEPPRLRALDLAGNRLTAEQLEQLLASRAVMAVEELDFGDNNLGFEGIRAVAAARLPNLRTLHLPRTRPAAGVRTLANSEVMQGLHSLSLAENVLNAAAAVTLAESPNAANLRVLDLRENRLGDAGTIALVQGPHLRNLLHLSLARNGITDTGANALAESPHLEGLIFLDVFENPVSDAAIARLRQRFGDRVIV